MSERRFAASVAPGQTLPADSRALSVLVHVDGIPVPGRGERSGAPWLIQIIPKEVHSSRWNP